MSDLKALGYARRDRIVVQIANLVLRLASKRYRAMTAGAIQLGLRTAARDGQFTSVTHLVATGAVPVYRYKDKCDKLGINFPLNPENVDDLVYEILKETDSIPEELQP